MPVNHAAQSSLFEHPTNRSYRHWTSEEDASLFAAVKQYGKDWTLVKAVVEQDGFTPRPRPCFPARWRTLEERAARQKWDVQRTQAAAEASPSFSTLGDASGSFGRDGSDKEGQGGQAEHNSTSAYDGAGQTRSSSSTLPVIKTKRGRGRPRKHPLPAQGTTSSSNHANSAAADQVGTAATANRSPQSFSLASRSTTRALDTPPPPSPQDAERGRTPVAGVESAVGASAPTSSSGASSSPLNNRVLTYSTDLHPNGCFITDLPPGFQVYIVTPTQCRVVVPAQRAAHTSLNNVQKEEQQCPAPADAPFAFRVKMDGSIEPLNLPEGTTFSREVVETEDGEVRTQERYRGLGGYTVLFDYRREVRGGSSDEGSAGERGE